MNTPDILSKHDWSTYWNPVQIGEVDPDEWQSALMKIVEDALSNGVVYTFDIHEWVKERAGFVPEDFWDAQYTSRKVEGGKMGMEIYCAKKALEKAQERKENEEAVKSLPVGSNMGTMSVNGKRIMKCTIDSVDGYMVKFSGVAGGYHFSFRTEARVISNMIARAEQRGWRKASK